MKEDLIIKGNTTIYKVDNKKINIIKAPFIPRLPHLIKFNQMYKGEISNLSDTLVIKNNSTIATVEELFYGYILIIKGEKFADNLTIEWENESIIKKKGFYSLLNMLTSDQVYYYLRDKLDMKRLLIIKWIDDDLKEIYDNIKQNIIIINVWEKHFNYYWPREKLYNMAEITKWTLSEVLYKGIINVEDMENKLLQSKSRYSNTYPAAGFLIRKDFNQHNTTQAKLLHPDYDLF